MSYIYETHAHTVLASACGKSYGSEYISFYKSLGYHGIIMTDHFFNGNCAIPKDLPWEERVELFCKGYEEAKAEGDRQNFQVFFSWECRFDGDEFLVYGLDKEWLLAHPDMLSWDHVTHYQKVKEAGGLVIQAHPFRERDYLTEIYLHPYQCDGWEVANAGNPAYQDKLAYQYAKKHHMVMSAGSDIHTVGKTSCGDFFGVAFDTPLTSIHDYVTRMKAGEGKLHVTPGRLDWEEGTKNTLPVFLFDTENKKTAVSDLDKFLF